MQQAQKYAWTSPKNEGCQKCPNSRRQQGTQSQDTIKTGWAWDFYRHCISKYNIRP